MPTFSAVLLDLDGLLVDTESAMRTAGLRALAGMGHDVGVDLMDSLIGLDQRAGHVVLRAALGPDLDLDQLTIAWSREVQAHYAAHGIATRPGAGALFDLLDALNLPRAVVTSSARAGAVRKLTSAGLIDRIGGLVGLEDVTRAKPDPQPYLKGAALFDADPARCLAFEDSNHGAAAARAAGCIVVQVPDILPAEGGHAHWIAEDLISGARAAGLLP